MQLGWQPVKKCIKPHKNKLVHNPALMPAPLVVVNNNNIAKVKHATGKLGKIREKIAKYDAELKMSKAEAEIAAGRYRGPLHGVPFGLKDMYDTAGIRTTAHSKVLADNVPRADAAVVTDVNAVARSALGARMGERTHAAVARAESRTEALTLLLMSPEFQRR